MSEKKREFGLTIFGRKVGCLPTIILLIVLALGMLILAVGVYLWLSHETKKRLDFGYGTTTSADSARLEIGDKVFSIPKNHIWSRENWRGGKVQGVNMYALLPDFEPYIEVNRHEFDKRGWHRVITLLLEQTDIYTKGKTSLSRLEHYRLMLKEGREPTTEPGPFGLTRVYGIKWADKDEFYIGTLSDESFYWVRCTPEGQVPFPSCQTDTNYSDYTKLHYTFAKRHLPEWKIIDKNAMKLINQFETNTNQGTQK